MVNANWPLDVTSIAFNADPNDAAATASYTDVSSRVRAMGSKRGRQYELDQVRAGEATFTFSDKDEAFNPTNSGSAYYPNVKPYRQIIRQCMWPPTVALSAGPNLLNATAGYDPGFEATAVGATPTWIVATSATTPFSATVTATTPRSGSHCLTWSILAGGGAQGVLISVPCIPGQQYTASGYVRQSAANTTVIALVGGSNGTNTTATGAYNRITLTFTATLPTHYVVIWSTAPANNSTVLLDDLQLEPGAAATTASAVGPVIYGVFGGYVERWPSAWNHQGTYGLCQALCVDALAVLAGQQLSTEYVNSVLAKAPDYYWPLSEADTATSFADQSGNNAPALGVVNSKYGPGFVTGGQAFIAPGDPNGTATAFTATVNLAATLTRAPASNLQTGMIGTSTVPVGGGATWGVTVSGWFQASAYPGGVPSSSLAPMVMLQHVIAGTTYMPLLVYLDHSPGQVQIQMGKTGSVVTVSTAASYRDSAWHHFIAIADYTDGVTLFGYLYVDDGTTYSFSSAAGAFTAVSSIGIEVGGQVDQYGTLSTASYGCQPALAHIAVWNRALTIAETADLWAAAKGYANENSGARAARYLGYNFTGPIACDTGASTLDVSSLTADTSQLDACQGVATSENGVLFAAGKGAGGGQPPGTVLFKSRTSRYLQTTSLWTFGESESPYESNISFDFDPQLVYNDVSVTRTGGVTARSVNAASRKAYFTKSYDREVNVATDAEATDAANYILNQHKDPTQRVSTLSIKPSANPALWPVALGAEIGDRCTVKRRTGAFTMSADYFIESIDHNNMAGEWTTTFQMSPVDRSQVWILGDSTYGVLDTTSVLGY